MLSARVKSAAKVNLFLKVLGKRPDGYHEIRTLMQPVTLYDELFIKVGEAGEAGEAGEGGGSGGSGISVECESEGVPSGPGNLAWKAARVFLDEMGLAGERSVRIEIYKRIPVGAGLGGGSGNAAAVLVALDGLLGTGLGQRRLVDLAARIGSDVPFFVLGSPALASGRGEVLERVELPALHYCLINPGFSVSTAWAYGNLDLTKKGENNTLLYSKESLGSAEGITGVLANDLEAVAVAAHPEITRLKDMLLANGAMGALMSGSGPTVFGIFPDNESALAASLVFSSDETLKVFTASGVAG